MSPRDDIYREGVADPGSFRFDERVVAVFPDMINRSVPGYGLIVPMIGQLAKRFAQPGSRIHDLGCSLGASTFAMRRRVGAEGVRIIATDSSRAMVDKLRSELDNDRDAVPVDLVYGDIRETDFTGSSFVVLNFTLQFVPPDERAPLVRRISDGLNPGGALVLSEKIRFDDEDEQRRMTAWHEDFKRLQGYSELEIAGKRTALEKVLQPETAAMHERRLREAGFRQVTRWFQCFGFCSFLAEK